MVTTVQVDEETLKILRQIKERKRLSSYDEVLKLLIRKAMKPGKSMYGVLGKMPMKNILDGLRDERDRV